MKIQTAMFWKLFIAILILLGLELKTPSVFRLLASSFPPQHLVPVTPVRGRPVRGARPRFCVGLEHGLDGGDGGQGQSAPACAPQQKLWRLKTSERSDGIGGAAGGEEEDVRLRFAPSLRGVPGASKIVWFCFSLDRLRAVQQPFASFKWLPVTRWCFPSLSLRKRITSPGDVLEQLALLTAQADPLFAPGPCLLLFKYISRLLFKDSSTHSTCFSVSSDFLNMLEILHILSSLPF